MSTNQPKHIFAGLDIGSSITRVVVCEADNKNILRVIGSGESKSQGMRHGYVVNKYEAQDSVAEAIKSAERSCNRRINSLSATIGGITLSGHSLKRNINIQKKDGLITDNDIFRLTKTTEAGILEKHPNRQVLHLQAISYNLDGKYILGGAPVGMHGQKLETKYFAITCLTNHLENLTEVIQSVGVDLEYVFPSPLATYEFALKTRQRTAGAILIDLGAETTTVAVVENNQMISLEVFPLGSSNITNDIALGFQIPLEEAESIKTGALDDIRFTKKKVESIVEARLNDIFELVRNHLKKVNRDRVLPGGAVIIGGGSGLATVEEMSRLALKIPSKALGDDQNNQNTSRRFITDASWYSAYGACQLTAKERRVVTNSSFSLGTFSKKIKNFLDQFLP